MLDDAAATLAALQASAADVWEQMDNALPPRQRVDYRRDGLITIFNRLEELKVSNEALVQQWSRIVRTRATCKVWMSDLSNAVDERMDIGRIPVMVGKGLAWEERRVAHRTAAVDHVAMLRRFEQLTEVLKAAEDECRVRLDAVRAERMDLNSQTRQLNVAAEIGEL